MVANRLTIIAALACAVIALPRYAQADVASIFTDIGTLGGATSSAMIVDNDMSLAAGSALNGEGKNHAFRWTPSTGIVDLGSLGGQSYAYSASLDGQTIVGSSYLANNVTARAYRWTQSTGMVDLGTLGGTKSFGLGVSSDGNTATGYSYVAGDTTYHAFRWTQGGGMVDLGTLGGTNSYGYSVSGDGTVISGHSQIAGNAATHAFRWTLGMGFVDLGTLGGTNSNVTYAMSYDGSVIAGHSQIVGNAVYHAFRWTQMAGMVDIGSLGGSAIYVQRMSHDGSTLVGSGKTAGDAADHAFRWTQETGMRDLNDLFAEAGINMSNTVLRTALGISPDGKIIAGSGYFNGSPNSTAFLACYDPANGCVGLTTASKQEEAANDLAANQQTVMTESRAAANELMGFTRPVVMGSQTFSGAMFGSAMGYAGGQYSKDSLTLLGGLGYGAQDYKYIKPESSLTVASGLRYTFGNLLGAKDSAAEKAADSAAENAAASRYGSLAPFIEVGGWVTPHTEVELSRPYNNGVRTNKGVGNTTSSSSSAYLKSGLVWDRDAQNQLATYLELGRQYMSFEGYQESESVDNPFPATVNDSEMRYSYARAGGSYTRQLGLIAGRPSSFTVAAALAHSFGVHTNLTTTTPAMGTTSASAKKNLWGEYGARLETGLTDHVALNLDITGTTGNNGMGTAIHGGTGLSVRF